MLKLASVLAFLFAVTFMGFIAIQIVYPSSEYAYNLNSTPYNETYQYWSSQWWQWHISIPSLEHPRENYTPERCSLSQNGPVWFLADGPNGKTEERECTIPQMKSIIVQVLGGECDYGEANLKNDADIITCVEGGINGATVMASLDGKEISDLQNNRIGHYWFNITVPRDNIYEEPPGTYRALVDGYFLFLKPLPKGTHELVIRGDHTSIGPDGIPTEEDHHMYVQYNLRIE